MGRGVGGIYTSSPSHTVQGIADDGGDDVDSDDDDDDSCGDADSTG